MVFRSALLRRVASSPTVLAVAAVIAVGCGGISPIAVLNFVNQGVGNLPGQGGAPPVPATQPANINTTCDLPAARKSISIQIRNESAQDVNFSITLLASAGSGGFVCQAERPIYSSAGYTSLPLLMPGNVFRQGCAEVSLGSLRGGNEMLGVTFTGSLAPNPGATPQTATIAGFPLDGVSLLPLPEVIVLGDSNSLFICQGNNVCSQGGFAYTNGSGILIDGITSTRTQGTRCNANAGTNPEWRLLNPSQADSAARAFEYVAGANITISVLNRIFDANPVRNKATWRVLGPAPNFEMIHAELR